MKILKHGFIVFFTFCFFTLAISYVMSLRSFASWNNLMIGSSSNALYTDSNAGIMTLDLDESDYSIGTLSTLGTVTNTVSPNVNVPVMYFNSNGILSTWYITPEYRDGRFHFSQQIPGKVFRIDFGLFKEALPVPGGYRMSFDFASDFSIDYSASTIRLFKSIDNAELMTQDIPINCEQFSGDIYISPFDIQISNLSGLQLIFNVKDYNSLNLNHVGGSFAVHFTRTSISDDAVDTGMDTSTIDYQNNVSSSLSDLSSSVDTMTDEISGVTEAIQNLQGAMEPHYNNVLTQLHHITEQLHAFYDQVYNNIHLAQMNMLSQIKEAIENIDLEVNISLDGLKQTIQQVGQNVITNDNKISADQIANDEANTEEVKDAVKEHGNFIIDGLKGLFIPSDEFFKAYFDDLYSYFSDRFGFLSFPIDLLVRTVNLFINSSDVDAVLTLPSFEISGEQVWADQSFNFTEFMETNFAFLLAAIRTVTSIGMIYAFVNLCQDKWDEVMRS